MKYLFYTDWLDLIYYICKENELDFLKEIENPTIQKLDIEKWEDINDVGRSEDMFSEASEEWIYLVNVLDLPLKNVQNKGENQIYLYSTTSAKTLAQLKTSIKGTNLELIEVKKPKDEEINEFIQNFCKNNNLKLGSREITRLIKETSGLTNIKNILDLLLLVPDHFDEIMKSQTIAPELPIFMKKFDLSNFQKTIRDWQDAVETGNKDKSLQFILSIVAGKIIKSGHEKTGEILKLIAKTDYNFKMGKYEEKGAWLVFLNDLRDVIENQFK